MRGSFCSRCWQLSPSLVPLPVHRSQSCSAVGDCAELVDSSHRASFMRQVQRKEPFIAPASWSGTPCWAPHKAGASSSSLESVLSSLWRGRRRRQPRAAPSAAPAGLVWCSTPGKSLAWPRSSQSQSEFFISEHEKCFSHSTRWYPNQFRSSAEAYSFPRTWSNISVISLTTHLALREGLKEIILMRNNIFPYTGPLHYFSSSLWIHPTSFHWVPAVYSRHFRVYQREILFSSTNICWKCMMYVPSTIQVMGM